ncbi:MAG: glycosyltransferase involved in cell wall biosynthesis, partial [Francisellaceae bacterium]
MIRKSNIVNKNKAIYTYYQIIISYIAMTPRNIHNPNIYAVVPVYNEEFLIIDFITALNAKLKSLSDNYKIVMINDGSSDETAAYIQKLSNQFPVKFISFSRNFGKEAALCAGLQATSEADVVVILDSDFQHPLEVIDQFFDKWKAGYSNIYGIRSRNDQGKLKRTLSSAFYAINNIITRIHIPANAGDFRMIDKEVVTALNNLPEVNRFMKGLYAWVGFEGCEVPYTVAERADGGKSKWNYKKLFSLALTGMLSFSDVPLRFISFMGFIVSFFAIIYAIYLIFETWFMG